jgi:transcriptional regulator with XRE-family HTH domain
MKTTQSAVARIESGRHWPSRRTLESYAKATGTRAVIKLVAAK